MKINIYLLVFGILALIIVAAAASTFVFNQNLSSRNVTLQNYGQAPNFQGITAWINSPSINITQLRGKVVLVDFWTYSCINCIRTIPFLNALDAKYGREGLVIVGVHSPEFQFEANYTNVLNAVQRFGIEYPVALDSNHSTWDAYHNQYWPADYIIDANGTIRYEQFGEGDTNTTQIVIQQLLKSAGYNINSSFVNFTDSANFSQIGSPETYFGYSTARAPLGNAQGFVPGNVVNYIGPNISQANTAYLSGEWYNAPDGMVAVNNSKIFFVYKAKNVNIVASGNSSITIRLDESNLQPSYLGADDKIVNGSATAIINSSRLYDIVSAPSYGIHILEIDAKPGFKIYTFTLG
ncbi:MAG: redoxin domain-containing protein [Candidatus Micrarchaeales archaeon]